MADLTGKQKAFVYHYAQSLNATEAAHLAGYAGDRKQLRVTGSQNLAKVNIRAAIDAFLNEKAMKAEEVVTRLTDQARADIGVFFKVVEEWTFYPLPMNDILDAQEVVDDSDPDNPRERISYLVRRVAIDTDKLVDPEYSHLLHKVSDTKRGGLTIELYNKQTALAHLGKIHALFVDRQRREDWRTDAIKYIRDREVSYEALSSELGADLATELFAAAGVPVESGTGAGEN